MAKKGKETPAQRQARAKSNYHKLKAAGFTAKEAERYRYSTDENIAAAIQAKNLPAKNAKKRGAQKKVESYTVERPYAVQMVIELAHLGDRYLQQVQRYIHMLSGQGFEYYSLFATYNWSNGMSNNAAGIMSPINSLSDLGSEIAAFIRYYLEKYRAGSEDPVIDIAVHVWKPK